MEKKKKKTNLCAPRFIGKNLFTYTYVSLLFNMSICKNLNDKKLCQQILCPSTYW